MTAYPLKVREPERLSERMSRGVGHLCGRSSESAGICSSVLHAKPCSTCKDAGSLAGAVGIKAEVSWRNVPDGCSTSLLNAASAKRRGLDRFSFISAMDRSTFLKEGCCGRAICAAGRASLWYLQQCTACEAMQHLQRCRQSRRCGGHKSGSQLAQRARWLEHKPSERSFSEEKRA